MTLPAELVATLSPTQFLGYDRLQADGLSVLALLKDGRPVQSADAGDAVIVITNQTPFYAESGGQVGDTGVLTGNGVRLVVEDPEVRRPVPWPCRHPVRRRPEGRRRAVRPGRWRAPWRHHPQPLGHPPAARRAARSAGHSRAAEGLAGRAGPPALRLLALPADQCRRTGGDRAQGQPAGARQQRRRSAHHGHAGSAGLRRDGLVRREVRRARARAEDG